MAIQAMISTAFGNAISESHHFRSLMRLKMAAHPRTDGDAESISVSLALNCQTGMVKSMGGRLFRVFGMAAAPTVTRSAAAYELPALNLGFTSFVDGAPPAGPGWYVQQYVQLYRNGQLKDDAGNDAVVPTRRGTLENADVDVKVGITQLVYQSHQPLLWGGKWGVNPMLTYAGFDLSPSGSFSAEKADQARRSGFSESVPVSSTTSLGTSTVSQRLLGNRRREPSLRRQVQPEVRASLPLTRCERV